jgi:hypothetical protein
VSAMKAEVDVAQRSHQQFMSKGLGPLPLALGYPHSRLYAPIGLLFQLVFWRCAHVPHPRCENLFRKLLVDIGAY